MAFTSTSPEQQNQSQLYQIRIKGHLAGRWRNYFNGLTITNDVDGTTLLTGPITDQSALYGLLRKIRDSGMPLLSVNPVESLAADKKILIQKEISLRSKRRTS